MFSFILSCAALYFGVKAINSLSSKKEERESELRTKENFETFIQYLHSDDSQLIFRETESLLNELTNLANKEPHIGSIDYIETFEKTVHNFKIKLYISPTTIGWEVLDMSQPSSLKSHHRFNIVYDRSRKTITHDEMRINRGKTYLHDKLFHYYETDVKPIPFSFIEKFNLLNDAGWNKLNSFKAEKETQPLEAEMGEATDKIRNLLTANKEVIDADLYRSFEQILALSQKILSDAYVNQSEEEHMNIEFRHELNRMLEEEIINILEIYLDLDKEHQAQVKTMSINTLEKAHNRLIERYTAFQQEKVKLLKKTQLVMQERYE